MSFKTVQVRPAAHEQVERHCQMYGGIPRYSMVELYQKAWGMLTPDQLHSVLLGKHVDEPNVAGESAGNIHDACNAAQRMANELDELVDKYTADGKLTAKERAAIRRKSNKLRDAACGVAVHANEPAFAGV